MKSKILNWLKNNTKIIIIILIALLSFKGCQSCMRNQTINYLKQTNIELIDSTTNIIDSLKNVIKFKDLENSAKDTLLKSSNNDKGNYYNIYMDYKKDNLNLRKENSALKEELKKINKE